MRRFHTIAVFAVLGLSAATSAGTGVAPGKGLSITALPRDLEIQLALSSLPPNLRDSATVYVLNPARGFEVARQGTNGFHALVARTGDDAFRGTWPLMEYPKDILYPIGFDAAGAGAQLRVFLDIAEMQARGTPPNQLKQLIQERYRTGYYRPPGRAGIAYMLSPVLRTYLNPEVTDQVGTYSIPHVMYYAPNVSPADIGAGKLGGMYPFLIFHGPHGYMVQLLGKAERTAIDREYAGMLARLCELNSAWCVPEEQGM